MICPVCKENNALYDPYYGWIPCKECQKRQSVLKGPGLTIEFTTDSIKDQRKAHADDIIQPYRKGELSKEYIDKWGTKGIKVGKKEAKKAKYTWNDDTYYKK